MADFYWRVQYLHTPTIGNPDDLISHAAQRIASSSPQCRAHSNKHFKTVFLRFRTPVVPATVIPWYSSFSWLFPKIRRNLRLFIASFASLLSLQYSFVASQCLRFSLFPKIRRFWRHLTHRSLCFVFPVLLSSFTPATVHSSFSYIFTKIRHRFRQL